MVTLTSLLLAFVVTMIGQAMGLDNLTAILIGWFVGIGYLFTGIYQFSKHRRRR